MKAAKEENTSLNGNLIPVFERVVAILEQARSNVVRSVNSQMVIAYWLIGREIVEEEQQGKIRAQYGKRLIEDLSRRLTERYGKGYSETNLKYFRSFFLAYPKRISRVRRPAGDEFATFENYYPVNPPPVTGFHADLSWSHYRALMRV